MFQSTRPRGARLLTFVTTPLGSVVSIHAPTWGATFRVYDARSTQRCFNPRAHVGRDPVRFRDARYLAVSIHAPTWGATPSRLRKSRPQDVSIHAPTWGATLQHRRHKDGLLMFQSTRPRGARRPPTLRSSPPRRCFNPRAHVGRDFAVALRVSSRMVFQSTRPRGARPIRFSLLQSFLDVSIHAPTWGATTDAFGYNPRYQVSIHAPTWGATRKWANRLIMHNVSIHAPTWGATFFGRGSGHHLAVSIHAPTWGATDKVKSDYFTACGFNPRAHVGRDFGYTYRVDGSELFQSTRPRGARRHKLTASQG